MGTGAERGRHNAAGRNGRSKRRGREEEGEKSVRHPLQLPSAPLQVRGGRQGKREGGKEGG